MQNEKPKILIVEDDEALQSCFELELQDSARILAAFSLQQARKQFAQNPDIAIIVMDACVPGNHPTALPLVREFREQFQGLIIAVSSIDHYRKELLAAGCDQECDKSDVGETVLRLLAKMNTEVQPVAHRPKTDSRYDAPLGNNTPG
jgi:DNA-binding NarL/FixJ family response regulator